LSSPAMSSPAISALPNPLGCGVDPTQTDRMTAIFDFSQYIACGDAT